MKLASPRIPRRLLFTLFFLLGILGLATSANAQAVTKTPVATVPGTIQEWDDTRILYSNGSSWFIHDRSTLQETSVPAAGISKIHLFPGGLVYKAGNELYTWDGQVEPQLFAVSLEQTFTVAGSYAVYTTKDAENGQYHVWLANLPANSTKDITAETGIYSRVDYAILTSNGHVTYRDEADYYTQYYNGRSVRTNLHGGDRYSPNAIDGQRMLDMEREHTSDIYWAMFAYEEGQANKVGYMREYFDFDLNNGWMALRTDWDVRRFDLTSPTGVVIPIKQQMGSIVSFNYLSENGDLVYSGNIDPFTDGYFYTNPKLNGDSIRLKDLNGLLPFKSGSDGKLYRAEGSTIYELSLIEFHPVSGVTIDKDKLEFHSLNETAQLKAILQPVEATEYESMGWYSSNPAVAEVEEWSGKVTAIAPGTATITVVVWRNYYKYYEASIVVTVHEAPQGKLQFDPQSQVKWVNENAGTVTVEVYRVGGSGGKLMVNYSTAADTAAKQSDFIPASGTLTFANGETKKTILIQVVDDAVKETTESFLLKLDGPVEVLNTVENNRTYIMIRDND
ncbi:Ig-like protein group 2 [Paenibacillus methanolicus]|uniref:Ig-like protein group 2 n=1 Tax=Paenibacillus methanolicus TaxID=582686 RepID=A0A5S5C6N3_9BACL|nr:Ig-like protein group 2 [Paenibacillus methanolicus]